MMDGWALILFAVGVISLIVLVGQHLWTLPRWMPPVLIFCGFGGVLAGLGMYTLALAFR
ncbi:hypothetical protein [Roseospira marina]|uniref:hypothetical protein n=1 Tax=Roseospira marina TaxID=140057 RepID=UPI0014790DFD|nr:hypothetical protein [Roseospira marina]MBB4315350.1 putative membrane protein YqjE [Roseospira marina]MBB5088349.1 putative membrane protein YqjE [Roseospira marina]